MRISGQAMTESILMLPIFLFFVFGLIQIAQLGIAVVMVNYAASSIARTAAASNTLGATSGPVASINQYLPNAQKFMVAGVALKDLKACEVSTPPTAEITVRVRAKVDAYPFFSQMLSWSLGNNYADEGGGACPDLTSAVGFGPFNFSSAGDDVAPHFYISGIAGTRLNYAP